MNGFIITPLSYHTDPEHRAFADALAAREGMEIADIVEMHVRDADVVVRRFLRDGNGKIVVSRDHPLTQPVTHDTVVAR